MPCLPIGGAVLPFNFEEMFIMAIPAVIDDALSLIESGAGGDLDGNVIANDTIHGGAAARFTGPIVLC